MTPESENRQARFHKDHPPARKDIYHNSTGLIIIELTSNLTPFSSFDFALQHSRLIFEEHRHQVIRAFANKPVSRINSNLFSWIFRLGSIKRFFGLEFPVSNHIHVRVGDSFSLSSIGSTH
jgi:hypothetical protein